MTLVPNETERALNRQYDVCAAAREEYQRQIAKQAAEIERLRAALEDIASGKYSGIVLTSMPPQDPAVNRARAALGQEKGGQ